MPTADSPTQVNIHEAKSRLSQLIARVEAGEEIILARAGKPVCKLTGLDQPASGRHKRVLGRWKGRIRIAEDFDAPLPELEEYS